MQATTSEQALEPISLADILSNCGNMLKRKTTLTAIKCRWCYHFKEPIVPYVRIETVKFHLTDCQCRLHPEQLIDPLEGDIRSL